MPSPERMVAVMTKEGCRVLMRTLVPLQSPAFGAIVLISLIGIPTFSLSSWGGRPDGLRSFKNSSGSMQLLFVSKHVESALLYTLAFLWIYSAIALFIVCASLFLGVKMMQS